MKKIVMSAACTGYAAMGVLMALTVASKAVNGNSLEQMLLAAALAVVGIGLVGLFKTLIVPAVFTD